MYLNKLFPQFSDQLVVMRKYEGVPLHLCLMWRAYHDSSNNSNRSI